MILIRLRNTIILLALAGIVCLLLWRNEVSRLSRRPARSATEPTSVSPAPAPPSSPPATPFRLDPARAASFLLDWHRTAPAYAKNVDGGVWLPFVAVEHPALRHLAEQLKADLGDAFEPAIKDLYAQMSSRTTRQLLLLTLAFGKCGGDFLRAQVDDSYLGQTAAVAYGLSGDPAAFDFLAARFLASRDRAETLSLALATQGERAIPLLADAAREHFGGLKDRNGLRYHGDHKFLAYLEVDGIPDTLKTAANDPSPAVRTSALCAIARNGGADTLAGLYETATNPETRLDILHAISSAAAFRHRDLAEGIEPFRAPFSAILKSTPTSMAADESTFSFVQLAAAIGTSDAKAWLAEFLDRDLGAAKTSVLRSLSWSPAGRDLIRDRLLPRATEADRVELELFAGVPSMGTFSALATEFATTKNPARLWLVRATDGGGAKEAYVAALESGFAAYDNVLQRRMVLVAAGNAGPAARDFLEARLDDATPVIGMLAASELLKSAGDDSLELRDRIAKAVPSVVQPDKTVQEMSGQSMRAGLLMWSYPPLVEAYYSRFGMEADLAGLERFPGVITFGKGVPQSDIDQFRNDLEQACLRAKDVIVLKKAAK